MHFAETSQNFLHSTHSRQYAKVVACANRNHMITTETSEHLCVDFWKTREERRYVRVPKNIEDAKKLGAVLSQYKEQYYHQVLIAYFTSYVLYPSVASFLLLSDH